MFTGDMGTWGHGGITVEFRAQNGSSTTGSDKHTVISTDLQVVNLKLSRAAPLFEL